MAAQPLALIALAAADLKAAAPERFKTFSDTLRAYELQSIEEALASDAPDVFRAQGRVKAIQALRKHIVECMELRETYSRRESNGRPSG